jgi:hypothetical protein
MHTPRPHSFGRLDPPARITASPHHGCLGADTARLPICQSPPTDPWGVPKEVRAIGGDEHA